MRTSTHVTWIAVAAAAAIGTVIAFAPHSTNAAPLPSRTTAIVRTIPAQPGPTKIQCETGTQYRPQTLWLGFPSTIGTLHVHNCNMTFHGNNVVTLTLPGTKDHTDYRLAPFHPAQTAFDSYPFPKLTGNLRVTLTFKNGVPEIKAGGPDQLTGAALEYPKYLGSVLKVKIGHATHAFTFYFMG
jgi:hypothetical protein